MNKYYFVCGKNSLETRMMVQREIERWITSIELQKIVKAFHGQIPKEDNIKKLAYWLLKFSDNWDYRRKQREAKDSKTGETARWMLNNNTISNEQEDIVFSNIERLGLKGISEPRMDQYDYIIALGGARMSCMLRPRFSWELLQKKLRAPKAVVMLSGMRRVADSERIATDTYAPNAETEYDLINAGVEAVFNLEKEYVEERYHSLNPNREWAIRRYETTQYNYEILSISGPSLQPEMRRANSADTFRFFAEKQKIGQESKVLLVTSQIYVPYQQMEAIRTWALPNNVYVESVGFPLEWNDINQQGMMTATNYLQEIRSTIQAINRYLGNEV